MSKIPSFNIKSKLRPPTLLRGPPKASDQERAPPQPSLEINSRPSSLHECAESKEDVQLHTEDFTEPETIPRTDKVEKTSQNLSKLAEKLNTGNRKQTESASKLPQRPAFRKRTNSNSTKVSAGQAKDKSTGVSTHGSSPYGKTPHLATKPPLARPKSLHGGKGNVEMKPPRLTGIPGSGAMQNRQTGKPVLQEKEINSKAVTIEAAQVSNHSVSNGHATAPTTNAATSSKISAPSNTGMRKSSIPSDRFGMKPTYGGSSSTRPNQIARPKSADAGLLAPRSTGGLLKRGSKESLVSPDQISKLPEKRTSSSELKTRKSKENLRNETFNQPKSSALAVPQAKAPSQLKPPSKELTTMAVKLRSYGGKRQQRPLSYSAGKSSAESTISRRKSTSSSIKNSTSSSMQNLTIEPSPDRKSSTRNDSQENKPLVKSRSAISLRSERESIPHRGLGMEQASKKTKVTSGEAKVHLNRPLSGMIFPRSKSNSSSKTTSSSSSEFVNSGFPHCEPYQSTPLRVVSDEEIESRPFVDEAYEEISAVFEDERNGNANRTFPINANDNGSCIAAQASPATTDALNATPDAFNATSDALNVTRNIMTTTFDKLDVEGKPSDGMSKPANLNTTLVLNKTSTENVIFDSSPPINISSTPNKVSENDISLNQTRIIDKQMDDSFDEVNIKKVENGGKDEEIAKSEVVNGGQIFRPLSREGGVALADADLNFMMQNDEECSPANFLQNERMVSFDDSGKLTDESLNLTHSDEKSHGKTHDGLKSTINEDLLDSHSNGINKNLKQSCLREDSDIKSSGLKKTEPSQEKDINVVKNDRPRSSSRALRFDSSDDVACNAWLEDDATMGISRINDSYFAGDNVEESRILDGDNDISGKNMADKAKLDESSALISHDDASTSCSVDKEFNELEISPDHQPSNPANHTCNIQSAPTVENTDLQELDAQSAKTEAGMLCSVVEKDSDANTPLSQKPSSLALSASNTQCEPVVQTAILEFDAGANDTKDNSTDVTPTHQLVDPSINESGDSNLANKDRENSTITDETISLFERAESTSTDKCLDQESVKGRDKAVTNKNPVNDYHITETSMSQSASDCSSHKPNTNEPSEKQYSSLLTQALETSKDGPSLPNAGPKEPLKVTSRRRSLVRRNTSPYFTTPLPFPLSAGPSFRMPRELSISETEDGVVMDSLTVKSCQNDMKAIKTYLLRLKRVLQESDVVSPLVVKHPYRMGNSPPSTPTRPGLIGRSFSDASSWVAAASRSQEGTSFGTSPRLTRSSLLSSNKTDQEKMEDEISNMKEKNKRLESEMEELQHELECKNYTIKLLQTQLENQDFTEQIELLTEEKIILNEENQVLREKLEQMENKNDKAADRTGSLKDQFLEQSDNATKVRAGIVQRYYEETNDK